MVEKLALSKGWGQWNSNSRVYSNIIYNILHAFTSAIRSGAFGSCKSTTPTKTTWQLVHTPAHIYISGRLFIQWCMQAYQAGVNVHSTIDIVHVLYLYAATTHHDGWAVLSRGRPEQQKRASPPHKSPQPHGLTSRQCLELRKPAQPFTAQNARASHARECDCQRDTLQFHPSSAHTFTEPHVFASKPRAHFHILFTRTSSGWRTHWWARQRHHPKMMCENYACVCSTQNWIVRSRKSRALR